MCRGEGIEGELGIQEPGLYPRCGASTESIELPSAVASRRVGYANFAHSIQDNMLAHAAENSEMLGAVQVDPLEKLVLCLRTPFRDEQSTLSKDEHCDTSIPLPEGPARC